MKKLSPQDRKELNFIFARAIEVVVALTIVLTLTFILL